MAEPIKIELSETDQADLDSMYAEPDAAPARFHSVLEVWREVLAPAKAQAFDRVGPAWATRIVGTYAGIKFGMLNTFRDLYFSRIQLLLDILEAEIATDGECLNTTSPEEDVTQNSQHYRNLLRDWQLEILSWEKAWDCADKDAAVDLAALSEVHKMFFGQTGLTQFLDNIKFEFSDEDQAELAAILEAAKEA